MSVILVDRIGSIVFQNGVMRIDCLAAGPNTQERPAGTLLIPGNQVAAVLQALVKATPSISAHASRLRTRLIRPMLPRLNRCRRQRNNPPRAARRGKCQPTKQRSENLALGWGCSAAHF